jgi:hypothetical protein
MQQKVFDFFYAAVSVFSQVVFPNTKDPPALLAKRFGYQAIPKQVCRELSFPEWPIVYWQLGMLGASMPETAIDENDDTFPAKGEIRLAKMLLAAAPAADAMRPKKFCKGKFRVLVAVAANAGHDLGPFRFGEDVRHFIL